MSPVQIAAGPALLEPKLCLGTRKKGGRLGVGNAGGGQSVLSDSGGSWNLQCLLRSNLSSVLGLIGHRHYSVVNFWGCNVGVVLNNKNSASRSQSSAFLQ
jgi:hypothetical protein